MHKANIIAKFGADYRATDLTYKLGIDCRLADHIAERFSGSVVLETCTGGGFATIALAKQAKHVFTAEIDAGRMEEAKYNISIAGLTGKTTFIYKDVFQVDIASLSLRIDTALIDPDWADTDEHHEYRFIKSTTRPPSDEILDYMFQYTRNITLIQPPFINRYEFGNLPKHEEERLYLNGSHELYCLHFGDLARTIGKTEFRI